MEPLYVIAQLLLCSVCLSLAHDGSFPLSNGPSNGLRGSHEVLLRTGIIDVDATHRRLPSLTPTARRLLQQPSPAPATSPEWGPLREAQLWLLTLGPELHAHPQRSGIGHQLRGWGQQQRPGSAVGTVAAGAVETGAAAEAASAQGEDSPMAQFAERQAALLGRLHQAGCAVVTFLPPAAWMVLVSGQADLAPVLEAFPDVRMAPFGPPELRVSPELTAVVEALRRAGRRGAELLASGGRVDDLLQEVAPAETGLLLGALRLHRPAADGATGEAGTGLRQAGRSLSSRRGDDGSGAGEGGSGSGSGGSGHGAGGGASGAAGRSRRARVQVEVQFPDLRPADLEALREGQEGGEYHPAAAASADWAAPLAALSPADCPPLLEPDHGSPHLLLVSVCPAALEATVMWLAAAPQVSWLAPRMATRLHNLDAGAIVQTGGNYSAASSPTAVSSHPLWGVGLDGRNQIVGCGDSGLDLGNCFFNDPAVPMQGNIKTSGGMQYFSNSTHRKVVYYLAVVQDMLDGYGHGTHVSGTLVGSPYDKADPTAAPLVDGTGQAPAAKIAFMDLSRDRTDSVWTPGDLSRSYFPRTYDQGARVHSDSWGSSATSYDSMARAVDQFTWDHPFFLSVFAAGNSGDRQGVNTTVTSPAVSKNCIAVGATLTMNRYDGGMHDWVTMYNMTVTLSLADGQGGVRTVRVVRARFGSNFGAALDNTAVVAAVPADGCSSLMNAGAVSGKVVLVQRGNCYFTDKARSALAVGAKAVLVYNDRLDGGYFELNAPDQGSGTAIPLPVGGVPLATGRWLLAAVNTGTVTVTFRSIGEPSPYVYFEDIAPYSSFGPTTDGRIKPDIVAPGSLTSALAKPDPYTRGVPYCSTQSLQGTSMATPVVAGSALLVRQYFMDGYYPEGQRDASKGFEPTGALVKAVLLGGAAHMKGVIADTGMPLEDAPSYRQGFGRVSLMHSLPLPIANSPGWRLQVVDSERHGAVLRQGDTHRFCVRATGGPLRITLAWYDYPAATSALVSLVNNLDLQVRAAGRGGIVEYGNGVVDTVNTVEQVWYDDLYPGDVAITVSAPTVYVMASKQPYALVVQGKFSGFLRPPSDNSSSGSCAAQLAVIDDGLSTDLVTKSPNVNFYFSLQDVGAPLAGFECRLVAEGGATNVTWQPCTSPVTYTGRQDGRYSFQVRVRGEEVAATRPLLIDTTPPVTTLTSTLTNDTALLAASITSPTHTTATSPTITGGSGGSDAFVTSADGATFSFIAFDTSLEISYQCRFNLTNNAATSGSGSSLRFAASGLGGPTPGQPGALPGGPVPLGRFFNCSSPVEVVGMAFGDYQFAVQAFDEAFNTEQAKSVRWRVRYAPNTTYARMLSGTAGITNAKSLSYQLVGYVGRTRLDDPPDVRAPGAPGAPGLLPMEWLLLRAAEVANGSSMAEVATRRTWTSLTDPNLQVDVPQDDNYLVLARPAGSQDNSTWAEATVHVDTTPPVVAIIRKPGAIQSDPRVTVSFGDGGTEGEIRAYYCRWLGPAAAAFNLSALDDAAPAYQSCAGSSTVNVTEGFWLFQVKGRDLAGNLGSPTNVTFRTDLSPPNITVADPGGGGRINSSRVTFSYTVDDGPSGTGAVNVSCLFKNIALTPGTLVSGTAEYPSASDVPDYVTPCPQPAKYTVQEGLYMWTVAASDGAGLKATVALPLTVDFTPPTSRVFSPPWTGRLLPSKWTLSIGSSDKPDDSASGVAQQLCRLDATAAPPPPSPPPASPPPPLPSKVASVGAATGHYHHRRRGLTGHGQPDAALPEQLPPLLLLHQQQQGQQQGRRLQSSATVSGSGGGGGGLKLGDGTAVQLGEWHVCDPLGNATAVTYQGLSSGYYTFVLRAIDRSGNLGNATSPPYFFGVDATLPTDGSTTIEVGGGRGSNDRTKKIVIGVAILVGAVVLIASVIGIVIARRRHLRKRYAGPPPQLAPAPNGIAMQPLPPYTTGHSNGHYPGSVAGVQPAVMLPTASSGGGSVVAVPAAGAVAGVPYYPATGVVAGTPAAADPALAAALAVSAAEAERTRSVASAAAAAAAAQEEERVRAAIAASIEEENLRRAMQASLAAAEQETAARQRATAEQAALDAAIAASLASVEADQRRQHQQARAQIQQPTTTTTSSAAAQPSAPPPPPPPPGPPKESLI